MSTTKKQSKEVAKKVDAAIKSAKDSVVKSATKKEVKKDKEPSKISQIRDLFKAGKSNDEVVAKGFHKPTVMTQRWHYNKLYNIKSTRGKATSKAKAAKKNGKTEPKAKQGSGWSKSKGKK